MNSPYQQPVRPYQDRYKRDAASIMDRVYDLGPYIVQAVAFLIALSSLITLLAVDIITGKYSASYSLNADIDIWASLATTGLVIAIVGAAMYTWKESWSWKVVVPMFLIAAIPVGIDAYLDGLSVDIMRFGHYVIVSQELAVADQTMHNLYRIMIGSMSMIGEPLAVSSLIVFPVLKDILKRVFS